MLQKQFLMRIKVNYFRLEIHLHCIRSESSEPQTGACVAGGLQGGSGLVPVWSHGELLLAPGGGPLPSRSVGSLLFLREEVLLVVHFDWLG